MISLEVDHANRQAFIDLGKVDHNMRIAIRKGWFHVGNDLKKSANAEILRKPKSGRTYFIRGPSGRRRRHIASAPGETHANITGKLRRSIGWKTSGHESMEFGYGITSTNKNRAPFYDKFVEFGTSKMAARPSLGNAVKDTERNVESHFQREIAAALGARR